jgi:hypothetical protein
MAVGTVSSVNDDVWQLIETQTPSSSTSTTFSSISGYKKLMITYSVAFSTADRFYLQFNGDSTAGNYGAVTLLYGTLGAVRPNDSIAMTGYLDTNTSGYTIFKDTDKTTPKIIDEAGGVSTGTSVGAYLGTSPISSIYIYSGSAYTYTGTIKLYGVAA